MKTYYKEGTFPIIHCNSILMVDRRELSNNIINNCQETLLELAARLKIKYIIISDRDEGFTADFRKVTKQQIHQLLKQQNFNKSFEKHLEN